MKTLLTFLLQCFTVSVVFSQGLSLPYYTGFDSPAEHEGWQQFRLGFISFNGWGTGAGRLYHGYNVGGNETDTVVDWFVSPPLNLSSPSTLSMNVQTGGFSAPFPDNCEIWLGTTNPNPSIGNFVLIANLSYMQPKYQWLDTAIHIPFVSDSAYIAFKYKTIGAAWMDYGIDSIWVSSSAGIIEKDKYNEKEISISPNPFSSQTTLQIDNLSENTWILIYNSFGQKVKQIDTLSSKTVTLSRDMLPSGLYFVHINDANASLIEKIIIID